VLCGSPRADQVVHTLPALVRQRIVGSALGVLAVLALLGHAFADPPVLYVATMPGPAGALVALLAEAASALISGSAAASALTLARAPLAAMPSLSMPQSPLGSAAVTAIPASIGASTSFFHSSAVKLDLSAMIRDSFLRFTSGTGRSRGRRTAADAGSEVKLGVFRVFDRGLGHQALLAEHLADDRLGNVGRVNLAARASLQHGDRAVDARFPAGTVAKAGERLVGQEHQHLRNRIEHPLKAD